MRHGIYLLSADREYATIIQHEGVTRIEPQ